MSRFYTISALLAVLLNISAPARIWAQDDATASDTQTLAVDFAPMASWSHQKTALLFRNTAGDIVFEVPLIRSEENSGGKIVSRSVTGGVSANGRFAYSFDKSVTWNASKSKILKTQTFLRVFGNDSKPLWESTDADAPDGQEPLVFSSDGETLLLLQKKPAGWTASVRAYLGAKIIEVDGLSRVESAYITKNGAYALVKWLVPDQSATHTFIDVRGKKRKDIPSGDLYLGSARIGEDGKVTSGKKTVFDFNAPDAKEKDKK